jgi:6-pyruvoyltetrahydropterin/6-carboxytetrahydropterin synthase
MRLRDNPGLRAARARRGTRKVAASPITPLPEESMDRVYIARRAHFSAAHRLYNPDFTDEHNWETFGACNNPKGHGHNYVVEVWLCGGIDPATGYVFDLTRLKKIVDEAVIQRVDHKHLNEDVDFLQGVNPTAENLAVLFWRQLEGRVPRDMLHAVRVYETDKNFAEFRGEARS